MSYFTLLSLAVLRLKNFKTSLILAVLVLFAVRGANAQTTITVGATGYNYTTITDAYASIPSGMAGAPYTIVLESNYSPASETYPVTFGALSGASSTNTITIEPASGVTSITSASATQTLFVFNGATYITLDGRAGGTGSTNVWTIQNTGADNAVTIELENGANFDNLQYLNVSGSGTGFSTGGIIYLYCNAAGNSHDVIQYCNIGPYGTSAAYISCNSILAYGNGSLANSYITVQYNSIHDFWYPNFGTGMGCGIAVTGTGTSGDYGDNWTIQYNSFYRTELQNNGYYSEVPIYFAPSPTASTATSTGNLISNNYIGGSMSALSNSNTIRGLYSTWEGANSDYYVSFAGIEVMAKSATVSNNTISNIQLFQDDGGNTPFNGFVGIYIPQSTSGGTITVSGNTIGSSFKPGNQYLTTSSTSYKLGTAGNTTFTVGSGLSYVAGDTVLITGYYETGCACLGFMIGTVVSYSGTSLVVSENSSFDIGTGSFWYIAPLNAVWNNENGFMAGIWAGSTSVGMPGTINITGNTVGNLYSGVQQEFNEIAGIVTQAELSTSGNFTIDSNNVYNLSTILANANTGTTSMGIQGCIAGISQQSATTGKNTVSNNYVYGLYNTYNASSTANIINGIELNGPTNATQQIENGNYVAGLVNNNSATATTLNGIAIYSGTHLMTNNMIDLGNSYTGNSVTAASTINGIADLAAGSASNGTQGIYFNSVYLGGTSTGSALTFAFRRLNTSTGDKIDLRDNILVNSRSGGSGNFCVGYDNLSTLATCTEDYNVYYETGTGGNFAYYGTTPIANYGTMRTDVSNSNFDLNSQVFNSNPQYTSPTGDAPVLKIVPGSPAQGTGLQNPGGNTISADFYGNLRGSNPDIGCDQISSGCTAASITKNPVSVSVCAGNNTYFTIGASGSVSSYQWQVSTNSGASWTSVSNTGVYSNATTDSLIITGATAGMTGYQYRDSITGTCGGSAHSTIGTLTVNSVPAAAGTITGTVNVCKGQNGVTYSITAVNGATGYNWSLPTGASIAGGSNTASITVNYSATATSGNIVVTPTNTCGSGTASTPLAITVGQGVAEPGPITGNTSPCANTLQAYSVATVSGATSYMWTLPSGWTGTSTTNSINATTGTSGGTISVAANSTCGSSTAQTLTVTVTNIPAQPGTISGSANPCVNSPQIYSVATVTGATSYTWTLPSGWTGSSVSNSITSTPNSNSGTISVTANNTCGSSTAQNLAVTPVTTPATPGAITGSTSVCNGANQAYSIATVNGASTYTWTLPAGWSGSSTSNSINTTAGSTGGNIMVTAGNNCGTSGAQTLAVTVSQIPAEPGTITGNNNPCPNTAQTYSVTAVNGATSYTWTLTSGWTGTSTTNSINATTGSNGGTISVTANNTCGSSVARTLAVTINTVPSGLGAISGLANPCANSSQIYSVSAVNGATSYTWTLPNGWTGTSTTNSITTTVGSSGGTISVTADNACGSSVGQTLIVTPVSIPATPGAITGSSSVCSGTNQTYSVANVNGASAYTWTLPPGWSGSSTSASINATAGSTGGNITVTANNNCGNSAAQTLSITVNHVPAEPGTITGNINPCSGTSQPYSVAAVNGASSYTWTLPSGWAGSSTSNSINATTSSIGGTISVTADNTCGNSAPLTLTVTINSIPAEPLAITGPNPACEGGTATYSVAPVIGATSYTWTVPSGWSGSSATDTVIANTGTTGGTIMVTANNTCGSSPAQTLTVSIGSALSSPGPISGPDSLCSNTTQAYSITPVNGATSYTWTLPTGWTGSSTSDIINVTAGTGNGNIAVTANSACGSSTPQTLMVTAKPLPTTLSSISGPTILCSSDSATYSVAPNANTNYYGWALPNGWGGSSTTNIVKATSGPTGGTISVTAYNGCGASAAQTLSVSVNPSPVPALSIADSLICSNDSSQICVTTSYNSYLWNTGQTSSCIYAKSQGNYDVSVTDANNCHGNSAHVFIRVYPVANVTVDQKGDSLYTQQGTGYQWYRNDTAIANAHLQHYIVQQPGSYSVAVTDTNRCVATSSVVTIDSLNTGVADLAQGNFSVYPNPSSGTWQLQAGNQFIGSALEIFDENGRVVYRSVLRAAHSQIDLNYAASGIYLLKITPTDGNPVIQKLIKTGN